MNDPNYLRKAQDYDKAGEGLDSLLSWLQEASGGEFEKCECQGCQLLRMRRNTDPAYQNRRQAEIQARQEAIEQDKLNRDVE
jgi:hypothetical protein